MVEVTCDKCGTKHRLDDAEVPPSGKVIKCTGCKNPITVINPFMGAPRKPAGGFGQPPAKGNLAGGPALAAFDSKPPLGGTTGDVIDLGEPLQASDLANLPAPKRPSPLAGVTVPAQKKPKSSPLDLADLPAPKKPPPIPGGPRDIVDLPAPKVGGGGFAIPDLPAPKKSAGISDLPAPVGPSGRGSVGISDLPAPRGPAGISDLPAPKGPAGISDLPAPKGPAGISDLPAHRGPAGISDLPAHRGPAGSAIPNLPAPRGPAGISDLPAPKGGLDIPDLLTPKTGAGVDDLLTPKGAGLDDLLTPKPGAGLDNLPAPKGPGGSDLPAPRGFFDDIPAPKSTSPGLADPLELPAPKGFFDDVPAPRTASAGPDNSDAMAPKGFFDDVPVPAPAGVGGVPADRKETLDLDDLDLAPPAAGGADFDSMSLDLAPPAEPSMSVPLSFDDSLELSEPSRGDIPALELPDDLGLGGAPAGGAPDRYESMDLPGVDGGGGGGGGGDNGGVVQFQTPSPTSSPRPKPAALDLAPVNDSLELDDDGPGRIAHKKATVHDPGLDAVEAATSTTTKPAKQKKGMSARLQRIIALAILGVVAVGAGGFFLYKRWQDSKAAAAQIEQSVTKARKLLRSDSAGHWDKAAKAAQAALQKDDGLEEPRAIAAQAYLAAFLDEGVEMKTRLARGSKHVSTLTKKDFSGPDAEKAKALKLIIDGNPQRAVDRLQKVLKKKKNDQDALLYLGWAHASLHDHKAAADAFAKAVKNSPNRKTPALFGLAEAQLALGQVKEARESYRQVIDRNKDHVGALVGSAQAAEVGNFTERENQYLAILRRKDIEKADPRAVSRAWALAGDEALKAGRVDVAKTRYDEATKIFAANLEAQVGNAKAALRQGRLDSAREILLDVLNEDSAHLDANLTFAEAAARQDRLDEATTKVESLLSRDPPIQNPTDLARVYTVQGQILSADKTRLNEAIEAYEQARTHAGEDNVQPTVALSLLLSANDRRSEGLKLLEPLEAKAQDDPVLATTLGVAFLAADDASKAEGWFRKALAERPSDIEAHYQLGLSLLAQDKKDEAIEIMKKAYAIEAREDIGLRLAVVYESIEGRDDDAGAMYDTLLKADDVSINVTSRAGRFYSRIGNLEEAAAIGEKILAAEPEHPAGLFLKGEGLYHNKDYAAAVKAYREAVNLDPAPQYLDGLGRANERLEQFEDAVRAYEKANEQEPAYLNPLLGRARIRLSRRQFDMALDVLKVAREQAPDEPRIFYMLGVCYHETGKEKNAIANLTKALKLDNTLGEAHYRLGLAYMDAGKEREAIRALKAATSHGDDSDEWLTDAYYKLGFVARHKDKPAALKAYQDFLARDPKNKAEKKEARTWIMRLRAQLGR